MPDRADDHEHDLVTPQLLRGWRLPAPTGGKESRGRILIVGGSAEVPGAVLLAAEAAMRAGAGKLQVATAASVASILSVALPEALVRGLPETSSGALAADGVDRLEDLVEGASAVLVGPGMTDVEEARRLTDRLLPSLDCPVVLDALGIASVTADPGCLQRLAGRAVLTPNPSELALTLHRDQAEVDDDLAGAALELARRTGVPVAVGGVTSWVASPGGSLWRDESGGAGLGVSGSGDVRAGVTAGLLARGAEPEQAAVWAAHLHGRAGERLAAAVGGLGFLARELPAEIPRVLAELEI
ncbi:NAD(P)H-hydrate dehydratase [Trujillonella endophytica]|uniref:NAD(P)H-hydrate dehydratase n=1 Tax=Trujillonella endophytica TaxID=673521 RepID=UPI000B893072|nr:NAD(P)H-hydrate dehydratase [Trujillella endophytica]